MVAGNKRLLFNDSPSRCSCCLSSQEHICILWLFLPSQRISLLSDIPEIVGEGCPQHPHLRTAGQRGRGSHRSPLNAPRQRLNALKPNLIIITMSAFLGLGFFFWFFLDASEFLTAPPRLRSFPFRGCGAGGSLPGHLRTRAAGGGTRSPRGSAALPAPRATPRRSALPPRSPASCRPNYLRGVIRADLAVTCLAQHHLLFFFFFCGGERERKKKLLKA